MSRQMAARERVDEEVSETFQNTWRSQDHPSVRVAILSSMYGMLAVRTAHQGLMTSSTGQGSWPIFRGMATKYRRDTPLKPGHGDVNDKVLDRLEKWFI